MSDSILKIKKEIFGINYLRVLERLSDEEKEMIYNLSELAEDDREYISLKFKKIYDKLPKFPYKETSY